MPVPNNFILVNETSRNLVSLSLSLNDALTHVYNNSATARNLLDAASSLGITINFVPNIQTGAVFHPLAGSTEFNGTAFPARSWAANSIDWQINNAVQFTNTDIDQTTGIISSIIFLLHEVKHAVNYALDPNKYFSDNTPNTSPQYGRLEEQNVMLLSEHPIMRELALASGGTTIVRDNRGCK